MLDGVEKLVDGGNLLGFRIERRSAMREDDVAAVLERAASRKALERAAAHNDGAPCRAGDEVVHVGLVADKQPALVPDAPVRADSDDCSHARS